MKLNNRLNIMHVLFAKRCLLCGSVSERDLCPPCHDSLPHLSSHHCMVCALPLATASVCGACLANPPAFERSIAAASYAFPIDALLHSLKYEAKLALAPVLADLLTVRISPADLPDFILAMPLHPAKLRERGFNQALEIARGVSKTTGVELLPLACRRVRDTRSQTGLPWKEREKNIRGAFTCEADLSGRRIAIVDDVMTTGATLNELAKVLRERGACNVSAWVVARTLPDRLAQAHSES
ncbi:ComF family protein [Nitrosospira sp. Is2]|uniref:ComF family protein n=1 Tax=Nitrosospira sp. Is2 TaxID=3080532 RepID=UPI002953425E|nr:ComF family protein [Nitrosospira sp. Is2]WON73317.1 ComF family protein [Nitrosospira sp. Is2]